MAILIACQSLYGLVDVTASKVSATEEILANKSIFSHCNHSGYHLPSHLS